MSQVVSADNTATITAKEGTIIAKWYQKTTTIDGFAAGYCTAYAAARRPDIFKSDKAFRGNAKEWNERAVAA